MGEGSTEIPSNCKCNKNVKLFNVNNSQDLSEIKTMFQNTDGANGNKGKWMLEAVYPAGNLDKSSLECINQINSMLSQINGIEALNLNIKVEDGPYYNRDTNNEPSENELLYIYDEYKRFGDSLENENGVNGNCTEEHEEEEEENDEDDDDLEDSDFESEYEEDYETEGTDSDGYNEEEEGEKEYDNDNEEEEEEEEDDDDDDDDDEISLEERRSYGISMGQDLKDAFLSKNVIIVDPDLNDLFTVIDFQEEQDEEEEWIVYEQIWEYINREYKDKQNFSKQWRDLIELGVEPEIKSKTLSHKQIDQYMRLRLMYKDEEAYEMDLEFDKRYIRDENVIRFPKIQMKSNYSFLLEHLKKKMDLSEEQMDEIVTLDIQLRYFDYIGFLFVVITSEKELKVGFYYNSYSYYNDHIVGIDRNKCPILLHDKNNDGCLESPYDVYIGKPARRKRKRNHRKNNSPDDLQIKAFVKSAMKNRWVKKILSESGCMKIIQSFISENDKETMEIIQDSIIVRNNNNEIISDSKTKAGSNAEMITDAISRIKSIICFFLYNLIKHEQWSCSCIYCTKEEDIPNTARTICSYVFMLYSLKFCEVNNSLF